MLVNYSDSESDAESTAAPISKPAPAKPGFQASSGKIKVALPTVRAEPGATPQNADEPPPSKRARIGGGGINSFLPAPKKTAAQNAPRKGVSLKTSSEAAFSREVPDMPTSYSEPVVGEVVEEKKVEEPKFVGKATRFLPLSVSSKKKKKPAIPKAAVAAKTGLESLQKEEEETVTSQNPEPVKTKPKKSLFSVQQQEEPAEQPAPISETHEPLTTPSEPPPQHPLPPHQETNPSSLSTAASDLNLTPAQRRHLFGRKGANPADVNITHFNMDSEYASNEKMRQAGEVTEHRAVKAIAPGKHSLSQLVNNARTQKDGLEDAWAEGKRNRGEGASKYGWGK